MSLHENPERSLGGYPKAPRLGSRQFVVHEDHDLLRGASQREKLKLSSIEPPRRGIAREDRLRGLYDCASVPSYEEARQESIGCAVSRTLGNHFAVDRSGDGQLGVQVSEEGKVVQLAQSNERPRVGKDDPQAISRAPRRGFPG